MPAGAAGTGSGRIHDHRRPDASGHHHRLLRFDCLGSSGSHGTHLLYGGLHDPFHAVGIALRQLTLVRKLLLQAGYELLRDLPLRGVFRGQRLGGFGSSLGGDGKKLFRRCCSGWENLRHWRMVQHCAMG